MSRWPRLSTTAPRSTACSTRWSRKARAGTRPPPLAAQFFGGAGREYQEKYGARNETFAKVSFKARIHAARNPYALFRELLSVEEVLASPHIFGPLTRFQCCPPTCGAAAEVVVSASFERKHGLTRAVEIAGQALTTDGAASFEEKSMIKAVGFDMTQRAAQAVYQQAGMGPGDTSAARTSTAPHFYQQLFLMAFLMARDYLAGETPNKIKCLGPPFIIEWE